MVCRKNGNVQFTFSLTGLFYYLHKPNVSFSSEAVSRSGHVCDVCLNLYMYGPLSVGGGVRMYSVCWA